MEVIVFGGSFDPPHFGHLELLREAIRHRRPGRVYAVPAFRAPLKEAPAASPRDRTRMLELALAGLPRTYRRKVRILPFELRRKRRTFTYELLHEVRRRHPRDSLLLLVGSDCLRSLRRWRRWRRILKEARLLVGKRSGFLTGIDTAGLRLDWLSGLYPSIASTELRRRIAAGEDVSDEVPAAVLRYAEARGLYGLDLHRWLRRSLSRERYAHTLAVTRLVQDLAGAYRFDVDAARIAALLHDAGRSVPVRRLAAAVRRHRLRVPYGEQITRHQPILLHPLLGASIARRRFGITDPCVLRAIAHHTLGARGMRPLEKLLYVADIASEDRGFPEAAAIRKLAYEDLEAALKEAVRVKLAYVLDSGRWLHPIGVQLWNELQTDR